MDELIGVLRAAGVQDLVDVRTVPHSRRNPQFNSDALADSLAAAGLDYIHARALGGFRKPRPDSVNGGWTVATFRGYADYMDSSEFQEALAQLEQRGRARPTAVMCAEVQWWRCHRRLISDALVVRGWRVLHLGLDRRPIEHELTSFAVVGPEGRLTYPPAQGSLAV